MLDLVAISILKTVPHLCNKQLVKVKGKTHVSTDHSCLKRLLKRLPFNRSDGCISPLLTTEDIVSSIPLLYFSILILKKNL